MSTLSLPDHHKPLAAAILRRALYDVLVMGRYARDSWAWLMMPAPEDDEGEGWDAEDCCRLLELSLPHLRRALYRRGFAFPPKPVTGGQREKVPGTIPCRKCGIPAPSPDRRIQRTCAACGERLLVPYLIRRGLLTQQFYETCKPIEYTKAALKYLLAQGPMPAAYVQAQLARAGQRTPSLRTVYNAADALGIVRWKVGCQGPSYWALPEEEKTA